MARFRTHRKLYRENSANLVFRPEVLRTACHHQSQILPPQADSPRGQRSSTQSSHPDFVASTEMVGIPAVFRCGSLRNEPKPGIPAGMLAAFQALTVWPRCFSSAIAVVGTI